MTVCLSRGVPAVTVLPGNWVYVNCVTFKLLQVRGSSNETWQQK